MQQLPPHPSPDWQPGIHVAQTGPLGRIDFSHYAPALGTWNHPSGHELQFSTRQLKIGGGDACAVWGYAEGRLAVGGMSTRTDFLPIRPSQTIFSPPPARTRPVGYGQMVTRTELRVDDCLQGRYRAGCWSPQLGVLHATAGSACRPSLRSVWPSLGGSGCGSVDAFLQSQRAVLQVS